MTVIHEIVFQVVSPATLADSDVQDAETFNGLFRSRQDAEMKARQVGGRVIERALV
jgi:hypothetical protein